MSDRVDRLGRLPFERWLDEIAAAESVREVDHLCELARRELSGDPLLAEVEQMCDAKRRILGDPQREGA